MRFTFQLHQTPPELFALLCQCKNVDQDAIALHAVQHFRDRQFDIAIQALEFLFARQLRRQYLMYAQRDIGIFRCVFVGLLQRHLGE